MKKHVLLILGSTSDQPFADAATAMLEKLELGFELVISSAHRHPDKGHDAKA